MLRALMLDTFRFAFVQRGIVELLLLSICAGLVGSFVVLRGFSFFTHAVVSASARSSARLAPPSRSPLASSGPRGAGGSATTA